jgi:hypothetical protein
VSRSYASRLSLAIFNERQATTEAVERFYAGKITAQEAMDLIANARDAVDALVAEAHR